MKILRKSYLVLALLFVTLGGIEIYRLHASEGFSIYVLLIEFLPAVALFGAYLISIKINRMFVHLILIQICFITIAIFVFTNLSFEFLKVISKNIVDVNQYSQILDEYSSIQPKLISHFPNNIPPDVKNVKFSFSPGFLQGGAHIQIRYSTTSEQIGILYTKYSSKKIVSFKGGDVNDHLNIDVGAHAHTTFFSQAALTITNSLTTMKLLF